MVSPKNASPSAASSRPPHPKTESHSEHGPSDQCDHGTQDKPRLAEVPARNVGLDLAGIRGPGVDVSQSGENGDEGDGDEGHHDCEGSQHRSRPQSPSGRRSSDESAAASCCRWGRSSRSQIPRASPGAGSDRGRLSRPRARGQMRARSPRGPLQFAASRLLCRAGRRSTAVTAACSSAPGRRRRRRAATAAARGCRRRSPSGRAARRARRRNTSRRSRG